MVERVFPLVLPIGNVTIPHNKHVSNTKRGSHRNSLGNDDSGGMDMLIKTSRIVLFGPNH